MILGGGAWWISKHSKKVDYFWVKCFAKVSTQFQHFFKAVMSGWAFSFFFFFKSLRKKIAKRRQLPVDFNYDVFGFDVLTINMFLWSSLIRKETSPVLIHLPAHHNHTEKTLGKFEHFDRVQRSVTRSEIKHLWGIFAVWPLGCYPPRNGKSYPAGIKCLAIYVFFKVKNESLLSVWIASHIFTNLIHWLY